MRAIRQSTVGSIVVLVAIQSTGCPKTSERAAPDRDAAPSALVASAAVAPTSAAPVVSASASAVASSSASIDPASSDDLTRSADGKLAIGWVDAGEGELRLFDGVTKAPLRGIAKGFSRPRSMVFSSDAKVVYVGFENNGVAAYDVSHDKPQSGSVASDPFALTAPAMPKDINPNADYGVGNLTVSDDGRWLAGTCATVSVCVWSLKSRTVRMWSGLSDPPYDTASLSFQKGTAHIEIRTDGGPVLVLDAPTLKLVK
jgi:WD40 repeat protein